MVLWSLSLSQPHSYFNEMKNLCPNPSVLIKEHSERSRSIPWLMVLWLLTSPGHQQRPLISLCWINKSLSSTRKNFNSWWRHQMETFSALLALCAGNSSVPVNSPHKGQWRGALMFCLICAWINDWVNNREAGDLRRHRGHYDVNVMCTPYPVFQKWWYMQIYLCIFFKKARTTKGIYITQISILIESNALLRSQLSPKKPSGHAQLYPEPSSVMMHSPPLWHGVL